MMDGESGILSGEMQSSLSSFDDFSHISVEKLMSSSFTKSQYSQVIFHDLSEIYPTDSDIKCSYTLTDNVKPQAGDKIALFKVGWTSVSDYITFVRAQIPEDIEHPVLNVAFKAGTFPKKDNELYQLCYVTSGNVVAGASTPFSFHKPHESEFVAIEDPTDPGLIVFRSRVAQLQNDLEKQNVERDSLLSKYNLLEDRYRILKNEFDKCENELINSKKEIRLLLEKQEELIHEKNELENCLSKYKEEICTLNQQKNCHEFIEEDFKRQIEREQAQCTALQKQIEQMENERRVNEECCNKLKADLEVASKRYSEHEAEINSLVECAQTLENDNKMLQEQLDKAVLKDISLEDYQARQNELDSEKKKVETLIQEKERIENQLRETFLSNDNLMLDVGNLTFKLKEMSEKHNTAMAESHALNNKLKEAEEQIKNMKLEIQEQKTVMEQNSEYGSEYLKCQDDRNLFRAQFENLQVHHSKCDSKTQLLLEELQMKYEGEMEKVLKERNELIEKIKKIESDLQQHRHQQPTSGQKTANPFKDPASQIFEVISGACSHVQNVFEGKTSTRSCQNQTDRNSEQASEIDERLKEKLKMLLTQKAELSENLIQVKYRNAEIERFLVLCKEENAALKSRISVLEYELATLKNIGTVGSGSPAGSISSPAHSLISEQLDSLNKNIPVITEFNKIVAEQKVLEQKIQEEKQQKTILQSKVEFLLQEDAKMSNKLQEMTEKYEQLRKEKEDLSKSVQAENIDVLQKVLEENDTTISDLKIRLSESIKEREKLDQTVKGLRYELIGKISVDNLHEYKVKITSLEKELQKKTQDCKYMAKFIQERFTDGTNRILSCPICPTEFPSTSREAFGQHFDNHMS